MDSSILGLIDEKVFGVWFLIGAALVFWMQAGFAMVETGFARAKNAGNILMKNLMDFCIGTVTFILIGFGLFLGEDALAGFLGMPNFDIFTDYAHFDWSNFVFNLVFCATTATIVSGAMAERSLRRHLYFQPAEQRDEPYSQCTHCSRCEARRPRSHVATSYQSPYLHHVWYHEGWCSIHPLRPALSCRPH